jgi:serine phosphatase RsbU (regulator of sigma subunit)
MIDPVNIKTNTLPPSVIIEGLKVDGENVDVRETGTGDGDRSPLVLPPGSKRLEFSFTGMSFVKPRKIKFKLKLEGYDTDWLDNGNARTTIYTRLSPGQYTLKVIACNGDGVWNEEGASFSFYMEPYFWQTTWFYILGFVFAAFAVIIGYRVRVRQLKVNEKKLSALVEIKTEALNERTLQLEKAHAGLQMSKAVIEEKNKNIMASITYARKIQLASLPTEERLKKVLKDYFIIFKPRDIVSGDFYWFGQSGPRYFIAAVDCTGHGVPGAFLSMMGNMVLTEIVKEKSVYDPVAILMHLHNAVRRVLQQDNGESRSDDGMEVVVCMIDPKTAKVTFAGAGRPLYYICNSQFFEIKGDRKSIGERQREKKRTFTNHKFDIQSETVIYLTSDGYAHQNNSENKKYGSLRLKQFLRTNSHLSMKQQKDALLRELTNHQGSEDQRDDITIIGIKLKAGIK